MPTDHEPAAHEPGSIPRYLSAASRGWLRHLADDYDFTHSEWGLAVAAAETRDRAQTARRLLAREGLTITTPILSKKGEVVGERIAAHPAAAIARDSVALFARIVGQLGLDSEGVDR